MAKTEQDIKKLAEDYAKELEKLGVPVDKILLFGSYARGEARDLSDIDFAVISERFGKKDGIEFSGVLSRASIPFDEIIEAIGLSPERLENAPKLSFFEHIRNTSKVVYKKAA